MEHANAAAGELIAGVDNFVTYDMGGTMGGTSTDVALIAHGAWPVKRETIPDGILLEVPQLDIHTIGRNPTSTD